MRSCAVPLVVRLLERGQPEWIAGPPRRPVLYRCTEEKSLAKKRDGDEIFEERFFCCSKEAFHG
jgi:hypothetical protein